ncbi:Dicer-like protein 1 [Diatrype stigma]|uniref:Dicer-like protein 1 n=1 Tax=Diatrype stigma TaxID=117547 RepID=A0AAN9UU57_9PEZI
MSIPIRNVTVSLWKATTEQASPDTNLGSTLGSHHQRADEVDETSHRDDLPTLEHNAGTSEERGPMEPEHDDGVDSDPEDVSAPSGAEHPSRKLTQRRIQDNLHFSEWVKDRHAQIERSAAVQATGLGDQSVSYIVRMAESEKIINTPREYQIELFEKAKEKNIIAVLDTGTGKTLIAALLLRHTIGQELEDRKAGKPPRLSFFVVDKVSLAYQQYEVLKCNLDYKIARFYGSADHLENTEFWKKQIEENMIIVCTADILLTCLHRAFVTMAQINLLIFDEAHHTKKNHPYARIIKDFYVTLEKQDLRRPRILGMTASPVDSKTRHIDIAAAELEGLLHSDITTVDYTKFNMVIKPPEDTVIRYSARGGPFRTALWQRLSTLVGNQPIFKKLFIYAEACTQELGQWCADRVWQLNLPENVAQKIEAKLERDFAENYPTSPLSDLENQRLELGLRDGQIEGKHGSLREQFVTISQFREDSVNRDDERNLEEHQDGESNLRLFCELQPEDRIIRGNDFDMDYYLGHEPTATYSVPSTGALLTYKKSLEILSGFVSSLPHPLDVTYTAEAVGKVARSKQVAKCSAAFEACMKLRDLQFLDDRLQSTFNKAVPAMRNARLAISSKKQAEYTMRTKPDIWDHRGMPTALFLTVFKLGNPDALGRPSRPLAMLTRQPLPNVAPIPLFFGNRRTSKVDCISIASAMDPTLNEIEELTAFTLRVFRDVFSKDYKPEPEKMPYYLAPLLCDRQSDFTKDGVYPRDMIDWMCIKSVQATIDSIEWEGQPEDIFNNKFVTDPHDGARKFYTVCLRRDLKPTDPELPSAPKAPKGRQRVNKAKEVSRDIWNYSVSLWSNSRAKIPVRQDLPVIEAEFVPLRRNLLDEFEKVEDMDLKCYVVLQTLKLSALPAAVVAMAYNLPAIIFRLESNLIVLDACRSLDLSIRPDLALEAMTKDSDNTDEHSEEQINFQEGMGRNYERLEFLGDSFLKMSTTIALFVQQPDYDEYFCHVARMTMINNQNLFNNALELKLQESIRSAAFNRRVWYPDGLELLKGKRGPARGAHRLADKTIADVSEAIIGAAYLTAYDQGDLDLAIQAVTRLVNHENHQMMTFDDYAKAYQTPEWQTLEPTAVQEELATKIEEKLGYKFRYPRLLRSAFMHPSYATIWERIPSYQRLEHLGDALLDMVVVDFLFRHYPDADPQWLTEHKMAMVSNQFLGCLCVSLGLHRHMVSLDGSLAREVADYVAAITLARDRDRDRAQQRLPGSAVSSYAPQSDFWVDVQKPPKCLPDLVEAYLGALFVDGGLGYDAYRGRVQAFFDAHVRPYFDGDKMRLYDAFASKHPVTHLSHALQTRFGCAHWRLLVEEVSSSPGSAPAMMTGAAGNVICGVLIHGRVCEHAAAASGRYAKVGAARRLLGRLEHMTVGAFRAEFGCDCKMGGGEVGAGVEDVNGGGGGSEYDKKGEEEEQHC